MIYILIDNLDNIDTLPALFVGSKYVDYQENREE